MLYYDDDDNIRLTAIFQENLGNVSILDSTGAVDDGAVIRHTATTNKPTSSFLQAGCPFCCSTNSVKARTSSLQAYLQVIRPCFSQ